MTSNKLDIASRLIAATLGGYIVASLFSITATKLIIAVFSHPLGDSTLIATMASYLIFGALFIMSFSPLSARFIWLFIAAMVATLWLLIFALP